MFTFDSLVDTVQTSKKTMVKTFVQDEKLATMMNDIIDVQSDFAKNCYKAGSTYMDYLKGFTATKQ
jgi:hypothetical protein